MLFMTPNVIKNFLSKKATRLYPFEVREPFEGYRGELVNDIDGCIFCGMCSKKCPSQCITVDRTTGIWECDPYACIYCSICVEACPTKCLSMNNVHRKPAATKSMYTLQGVPPKPKKKAADTAEDKPAKEDK
ncbi:MAG: 4Fe-4S binding protein [Proteobacteria bacterium]|nr:4Fe-4S binding protein [Pseudomonadota bacterium]